MSQGHNIQAVSQGWDPRNNHPDGNHRAGQSSHHGQPAPSFNSYPTSSHHGQGIPSSVLAGVTNPAQRRPSQPGLRHEQASLLGRGGYPDAPPSLQEPLRTSNSRPGSQPSQGTSGEPRSNLQQHSVQVMNPPPPAHQMHISHSMRPGTNHIQSSSVASTSYPLPLAQTPQQPPAPNHPAQQTVANQLSVPSNATEISLSARILNPLQAAFESMWREHVKATEHEVALITRQIFAAQQSERNLQYANRKLQSGYDQLRGELETVARERDALKREWLALQAMCYGLTEPQSQDAGAHPLHVVRKLLLTLEQKDETIALLKAENAALLHPKMQDTIPDTSVTDDLLHILKKEFATMLGVKGPSDLEQETDVTAPQVGIIGVLESPSQQAKPLNPSSASPLLRPDPIQALVNTLPAQFHIPEKPGLMNRKRSLDVDFEASSGASQPVMKVQRVDATSSGRIKQEPVADELESLAPLAVTAAKLEPDE